MNCASPIPRGRNVVESGVALSGVAERKMPFVLPIRSDRFVAALNVASEGVIVEFASGENSAHLNAFTALSHE